MEKILVMVTVAIMLAGAAAAAPGGIPAAHGVQTWGQLVSDLAHTSPGAVADHIQDTKDLTANNAGGIPALHGVQTWGQLVSDLAHTSPGAVADHIHGV